jgi:hypothetical protein
MGTAEELEQLEATQAAQFALPADQACETA